MPIDNIALAFVIISGFIAFLMFGFVIWFLIDLEKHINIRIGEYHARDTQSTGK